MPIHQVSQGPVTVLTLDLPRANAIGSAFVTEANAVLDALAGAGSPALVITGGAKAFCAGLDLVEAGTRSRADMTRFIDGFDDLMVRVFSWPAPVVAAVNGPALAGGCVLALACDWRILSMGSATIGLIEASLGVSFPPAALEISRHALPAHAHTAVFLEARRLASAEALRLGVVDACAEPRQLVARAVSWAEHAAQVPGWRHVKADLHAATLRRIRASWPDQRERFLDSWFAAESQARIRAFAKPARREGEASPPEPRLPPG